MRQGELLKKFPLEPLKTFGAGVCLSVCLWTVMWFAEIGSKEFFSFMGLRKRDFSATRGCESSEANPVEQGGIFVTVLKCPLLRLRQEPPRPCRRNSHDSLAVGVVGRGVSLSGGMHLPITESKCSCNWLAERLNIQKPPRRDARVHRGGVMKNLVRRKHLRLLVRKCPNPQGNS